MTTRSPNQCLACVHLDEEVRRVYGATPKCAAFPNGIPDDIFYGGGDHRDPVGGERGGRVFKMAEGEAAQLRFAQWERWNDRMSNA
jgi:hypothetical protein